jgi:hypothetical protein
VSASASSAPSSPHSAAARPRTCGPAPAVWAERSWIRIVPRLLDASRPASGENRNSARHVRQIGVETRATTPVLTSITRLGGQPFSANRQKSAVRRERGHRGHSPNQPQPLLAGEHLHDGPAVRSGGQQPAVSGGNGPSLLLHRQRYAPPRLSTRGVPQHDERLSSSENQSRVGCELGAQRLLGRPAVEGDRAQPAAPLGVEDVDPAAAALGATSAINERLELAVGRHHGGPPPPRSAAKAAAVRPAPPRVPVLRPTLDLTHRVVLGEDDVSPGGRVATTFFRVSLPVATSQTRGDSRPRRWRCLAVGENATRGQGRCVRRGVQLGIGVESQTRWLPSATARTVWVARGAPGEASPPVRRTTVRNSLPVVASGGPRRIVRPARAIDSDVTAAWEKRTESPEHRREGANESGRPWQRRTVAETDVWLSLPAVTVRGERQTARHGGRG